MLEFDIITIFPKIFSSYLNESLIASALKKGIVKINIHNLRKWTSDAHQTVDDRPFGGGIGMVLKFEPIFKAVQSLKSKVKNMSRTESKVLVRGQKHAPYRTKGSDAGSKVILFTPRGKKFNQKIAYSFSQLNQLILICGRYEGVDERVAKHIADEELSIGDYDLMGGDLPAMVVIEAIVRLIPGVLSKPELLKQRITKEKGFIEYPQYTRPEIFFPSHFIKSSRGKIKKGLKWRVPKVLLSGHHEKIEEWRRKHQKVIEK